MQHRALRAVLVSAGLVTAVGGTAALANAASTPSAKPSATPSAPRSAKPHDAKDCPNMGGNSSNGASDSGPGGSEPQPSV